MSIPFADEPSAPAAGLLRPATGTPVPRAGVDPITDADAALAVVDLVAHRPPRDETIVLTLDDRRCGVHVLVVTDAPSDDHVVEVVERLLDAVTPLELIHGVIVASIRPDGTGPDARDAERWLRLDHLGEELGVDLVEWFVLDRTTWCPRALTDDPERW